MASLITILNARRLKNRGDAAELAAYATVFEGPYTNWCGSVTADKKIFVEPGYETSVYMTIQ